MDLIIKNIDEGIVDKLKNKAKSQQLEFNDYLVSLITNESKDEYDMISASPPLELEEYEEFIKNMDYS